MPVDLTELVRHLARGLVSRPDDVDVRVHDGEPVLYEIHVASEDQGRIIGREGRTIRAVRLAVAAAARKSGAWATVEVAD